MNIWGISAGGHDAALTVLKNGEIRWASHSERFSRIKNDDNIDTAMVEEASKYGMPNVIVWHENSSTKRLRELYSGQWADAFGPGPRSMLRDLGLRDIPCKLVSHHLSHAAGGYYTSGFQDAAILIVDAIGEWETITVWKATGNDITKVKRVVYPASLGLFYSAMTQRCGFKPNEEEYILMGLAAHGDPTKYSTLLENELISTTDEFPFFKQKVNFHKGISSWYPGINDIENLAAATQYIFNKIMLRLSKWTRKESGSDNLVLGGGCALNCVTNANIARQRIWDKIWIMPNPGDAGNSLGAALAYHGEHVRWKNPYLGYNIVGEYPVGLALKELLENGMVGIANGRAEFGPRALGNRSLLADPRIPDIRDRLNVAKKREPFRPFAPVILAEQYHLYFDEIYQNTSYMQYAVRCKNHRDYPGICNRDGTSRVQTVKRWQNPGLHELLTRWYNRTGCPMLVNTSLNIKGQPIVNDENDAMEFQRMYGIRVFCR